MPRITTHTNVGEYAIQGLTPGLIVRPSTQEDVAAALALANDAGAAVVPWGGGTQQTLGSPPARYDVALDMGGLDRVVEYEPADLTVTVEEGMALSKLQSILGERGQWLPLDPPLLPEATIGGVLATNASGPTRYRYGTARDLLIGITFALPSGELAKSGGRVVKNVAGYDLGKLQIGALGTLGVITQATFKVAPLAVQTETVAVEGPLSILMSIITSLADSLLAVNAIVISRGLGESQWRLTVQFAGGTAAVGRSQHDFGAFAEGLDILPTAISSALAGLDLPVLAKASVLPTNVAAVCEAFAAAGASLIAYPTVAIVYGAWRTLPTAKVIQDLRSLCVDTGGGALVLERAPIELKSQAGVWGDPRGDIDLMRRIKIEMDPGGILNPGRYIGGI